MSFFAALGVLHTWPLARFAGSRAVDLGDGILNNWLITSVSRRLLTHPLTVFDVNMYYPYRHALATLDHQLSTAVLVAPIAALSQNALLPANLFIVASFALAGLFTAMLVADITGSLGAGILAGCIYACSPVRLENLTHTHVLGNCWLPLALLMVHRFVKTPTWKRMALATLAFLALALASWYYAVSGALAISIVGGAELVRGRPRRWTAVRRALPAVVVVGLVLGAVARPYLAVSREYQPETARSFKVTQNSAPAIDRAVDPQVIQELAASVESYLGVADRTRAPWSRAFNRISPTRGARFFPGIVALVFGAVAVALMVWRQAIAFPAAWTTVGLIALTAFGAATAAFDLPMAPIRLMRAIPGFFLLLAGSFVLWLFAPTGAVPPDEEERWRAARAYLVLGALGVLLSFGQEVNAFGVPLGAGIYPPTVPPFNLLRASSRFGVLFSLSAAVLAGVGCAAVVKRLKDRRARVGAVALAVLAANAELFAAPIALQRVERMPDAYEWLKHAPPGPVLEFPIHGSLLAMYWSLYHGHPIVNGNGAMQPEPAQRLEEYDDLSPEMLESIRTYWHPRYVIVDEGAYEGDAARQLAENLARDKDELKFLVQFGSRAIYEIVGSSRGALVLRSYPTSMLEGKRTVAVHARIDTTPRGTPVLQVWGNGRLLVSSEPGRSSDFGWLTAVLPPDAGHGVNIGVMADYVLAAEDRPALGRTGRRAPADIAVVVGPERSQIRVNGHLWIGEKGYTVVAIDPEGRLLGVRAFNTSWSEDESHALAAYVNGLPPETTVVVASFYDASRSLTEDAVRALARAGLKGDLRGHFGWAHAAIGIIGAPPETGVESIGESAAQCRVGEPGMIPVELDAVRLE